MSISAVLALGLICGLSISSAHAQSRKRAKQRVSPAPKVRVPAAPAFSTDEVTLLYESCTQAGGVVTIRANEFTCTKSATAGVSQAPETRASAPPASAQPPATKPSSKKYTGASLADASNRPGTTGDFSNVHSIEKLVPMIQVGVTTRDQIVAALKEPISSSFDSTGTETAIFRESVAFWKTGGVGQLFTKKGPVKKTLIVFFKNGRVSFFQVGDQR
jgi:hypothetical protein